MSYFDHNATTPMDERVLEAMQPYFCKFFGNPSSLHRQGRLARGAVDTARQQVAELVGTRPEQVIFTSGGTEANNLALQGFARLAPQGLMAFGATEHPSVSQPMNFLREQGHPIQCIQVNANGQVLKEQLMRLLESGLHSLSLMLANNETGVLLDWPDLFPWLREKGVLIHGDAVQAAGKLPLDFNSSGAHCLSMSAHKIYGPKGVGALIMDRSLKVSAILHGGGQEMALRGGTENLPGIVGFGRAAELAQHELQYRAQHCLVLREKLEQGLARIPGSRVFAEEVPRLPNTTQISLSGIDGETLVMLLDRKGIAVSSGSACASALHEPSPVLLAMGVAPEEARRAVRISLGKDNTAAEVDTLLASLEVLSQAGGHQ